MECDVSVIIPIYNMAAHIHKGVSALLNQTCTSMEAIFIDDGSKDDSYEVCKQCIQGYEHFHLYHTENRGAGPARNEGVRHAKGEYLYFFDIDDTMEPDTLDVIVRAARRSACDLLVFGFTKTIGDTTTEARFSDAFVSGDDARAAYHTHLTGSTAIQGAPWNKLFRRDLTVNNGIEFPPLRRHQDEGFIMRYVAKARSVQFIPNVLYHHSLNDQASMWLKYRIDYWENVDQLCGMMNEILVGFNPQNEEVRRWIGTVYFTRMLDAMKVLFNPKWELNTRQRFRQLEMLCLHYNQRRTQYGEPNHENEMCILIEKKRIITLYAVLWMRLRMHVGKSK